MSVYSSVILYLSSIVELNKYLLMIEVNKPHLHFLLN